MKLLVAPSLPPALAGGLEAALGCDGVTVQHFSARFPADTPDTHWVLTLGGEPDWVVLTADETLTASPAGALLWRQTGLRGLILAPAYRTLRPAAALGRLLYLWPVMVDWCGTAQPGEGAIVPATRQARGLRPLGL